MTLIRGFTPDTPDHQAICKAIEREYVARDASIHRDEERAHGHHAKGLGEAETILRAALGLPTV